MANSQAGIGLGTVLSIGTAASPPTYTAVAELNRCTLTGRQAGTADVTNFQSGAREFLPTLIDSGSWEIAGSRIGGDAGQIAMEASFVGLKVLPFTIQLPKTHNQTTIGDTCSFTALVEQLAYTVEADKAVTLQGRLKISGVLTFTPGS